MFTARRSTAPTAAKLLHMALSGLGLAASIALVVTITVQSGPAMSPRNELAITPMMAKASVPAPTGQHTFNGGRR